MLTSPTEEEEDEDPWTEVRDMQSGQMYWWNRRTKETSAPGAPKPVAGPWQMHWWTGRIYYWNRHTNKTTELGMGPPWVLVPEESWDPVSVSTDDSAATPEASCPVRVEHGRVCMLAAMGYLKTVGWFLVGQRPLLWTAEGAQRALMGLTCMLFQPRAVFRPPHKWDPLAGAAEGGAATGAQCRAIELSHGRSGALAALSLGGVTPELTVTGPARSYLSSLLARAVAEGPAGPEVRPSGPGAGALARGLWAAMRSFMPGTQLAALPQISAAAHENPAAAVQFPPALRQPRPRQCAMACVYQSPTCWERCWWDAGSHVDHWCGQCPRWHSLRNASSAQPDEVPPFEV